MGTRSRRRDPVRGAIALAGVALFGCGSGSSDAGGAGAGGGSAGTGFLPLDGGHDTGGVAGTAGTDVGGASADGGTAGAGNAAGTGGTGGTGGDIGGTGGIAGTGIWRPFSDVSPWNTKIPDDPTLAPNSSALVDHMIQSTQWSWLGISVNGWTVPVYWVDSTTTPFVPVTVNRVAGEGFHTDPTAPIPQGATPDEMGDHHLCIIDRGLPKAWDCWHAMDGASGWSCDVAATADLAGTGVRPMEDGPPPWWMAHGARACSFPLIAGLITVDEMQAGHIEHALALGYAGIRSKWYTPPASTSQAGSGQISPDQGIPCGGRVQLDPSLDLDALGLSSSGKTIARALQEYGAYVGDYTGSINLYADDSPEALAVWNAGLLDGNELRTTIDLHSLRVLEWEPLHDGKN